ncbi:MAG TPA: ShlB/FhaC/HecB family hemolysin secretion/activation protein [Burkholderiaceae bacterium]|nr:ShlB/FhaC/HecB family hemolysin secretion/activation protein [Burkholderiaceae bacterium]HNG78764.1 ShlB/FhaC/HecB family hemolysin secretion/activation protein [Burkholderiaceae bacterium]
MPACPRLPRSHRTRSRFRSRAAGALAGACWLVGALCAPAEVAAQGGGSGTGERQAVAQEAVQVSAFEIQGNSLLPFLDLQRRLEAFKGRRTLAELQGAAAAVQQLYADAGYGGVVAFLPPQEPAALGRGSVNIQVLEGKIARVTVRGQQYFTADGVLASLPALVVGRTPHLPTLDAQMQIGNENPARHVRVLLKPGERPGETDAEVSVTDRGFQRLLASLDNSGNARTGHWRATLGWQHANLTDRDDTLALQYQTSPTHPSRVDVRSLGYRLPLYGPRLVFDAYAARSSVDGGSTATAAGDLRFNGTGQLAGLRLAQVLPRLGEADQRLALALDWRKYLNRCEISGLPIGACGSAAGRVVVLPLSLDYVLQAPGAQAWGGSLSLQTNLRRSGRDSDAAAFESVRSGARPGYALLRAGANGQWPLDERWSLRGRLATQYSRDALVPGEQFGLGGATSIRGYEERELAGDQGAAVSVELLRALLPAAGDTGSVVLQGLAFVDAGRARNTHGTPCLDLRTGCNAASWGAGLRLGAGALQISLDAARALERASETDRGDLRAHVAVRYAY